MSTKLRPEGKQLSYVPPDTEPKNQRLQRQQKAKLTSSSITSSPGADSSSESITNQPDCSHQGGIAHLKSLLRYMFTGKYEPAKEIPEVPTIPVVFQDCVLRLCGSPPAPISHLSSSHGDVHVFPLHQSDFWSTGQPILTYGRLSKIPSPKEVREQTKQAMEKKKSSGSPTDTDMQEHAEESVVVRIICHNVEKLQMDQRPYRLGDIYSGKIWVSII